MSHKATTWLASLTASDLSNSEFRVLFHLCDCHNPSRGCFPTQAYLMENTNCSNGTVNNALKALEIRGFIMRHKQFDQVTKRKRPTRYFLGFELDEGDEIEPSPNSGDGPEIGSEKIVKKQGASKKPSPGIGDGNRPKPSPNSGDGAISKKHPEPSPKNSKSHLQPVGDKPVKEPVKNQGADPFWDKIDQSARFWAEQINSGKFIPKSSFSGVVEARMLELQLVTKEQILSVGTRAEKRKAR